ncbi:Type IV leader peptidase family protein [Ruminococcaceae bacterium YRB3002]|nr:Type IV leader peptidase family protein [Ruminococcaceae bacterium YRB3002]
MSIIFWVIISIVTGGLMGLLITFLFGKFPESWLQDYDYDPKAPNFRQAKRMKMVPHGVISCIGIAVCYCLPIFFAPDYYTTPKLIHILVIMLLMPVLFLIIMADKLNRIIPDQFSIYILALGVLASAGDYLEGNIWFSESAAWYFPLLNRVFAAIAGGGFLWLIGFLSMTFAGREGMGQGDMKLLFSLGLLSGCYGLVVIVYVSVFSALIFAVPMLIRKNKRQREEEKIIAASSNPNKKRRELELARAKIHYADDPDYLAFGPFLATGCAVFIAFEPFLYTHMFSYFSGLGVMF